ncbi:MAG: ABC transporter permease [Ornithinibacter sp.]
MTTETVRRAPAAESPLPTGLRMPDRLPPPDPSRGVPFGRLVRVELRKMLDTRAGRWLVIAIGLVIAGALTIMFFTNGGDHPFSDYLQATTTPQAVLLPVVGILAVTSEWSQRTALVTFGLEPRRVRVAWAKLGAALVVGVGAVALSFALGVAAYASAIGLRGIDADWSLPGLALAGAAAYVLLGLVQGVGFGMLLRNTPAAVVAYFVLPTAWGILSSMVGLVERAGAWLDLNRTMEPLFVGSLTSEQWAQLGTAVGVWVLLPLVLGMWRLTRAEVK